MSRKQPKKNKRSKSASPQPTPSTSGRIKKRPSTSSSSSSSESVQPISSQPTESENFQATGIADVVPTIVDTSASAFTLATSSETDQPTQNEPSASSSTTSVNVQPDYGAPSTSSTYPYTIYSAQSEDYLTVARYIFPFPPQELSLGTIAVHLKGKYTEKNEFEVEAAYVPPCLNYKDDQGRSHKFQPRGGTTNRPQKVARYISVPAKSFNHLMNFLYLKNLPYIVMKGKAYDKSLVKIRGHLQLQVGISARLLRSDIKLIENAAVATDQAPGGYQTQPAGTSGQLKIPNISLPYNLYMTLVAIRMEPDIQNVNSLQRCNPDHVVHPLDSYRWMVARASIASGSVPPNSQPQFLQNEAKYSQNQAPVRRPSQTQVIQAPLINPELRRTGRGAASTQMKEAGPPGKQTTGTVRRPSQTQIIEAPPMDPERPRTARAAVSTKMKEAEPLGKQTKGTLHQPEQAQTYPVTREQLRPPRADLVARRLQRMQEEALGKQTTATAQPPVQTQLQEKALGLPPPQPNSTEPPKQSRKRSKSPVPPAAETQTMQAQPPGQQTTQQPNAPQPPKKKK